MDNRPIGVFDSGLGGLTGVRQLRRILPGEDIVYFGDTGRIPYGTRGKETIIQYAKQDIRFLLTKNVKFVMAACGTVSSTYPTSEAARLGVPYTGVLGATVRAAAAATKSRRIGVIGTPATIRSRSFETLLQDLVPGAEVTAQACPLFVPLVENGLLDAADPVVALLVERYLAPVREAGVDTLILGCTHYPLLAGAIGAFMGGEVALIDPAAVTANAMKDALSDLGLLADREEGRAEYYVSDTTAGFETAADLFLGEYAGGSVTQIAIENY